LKAIEMLAIRTPLRSDGLFGGRRRNDMDRGHHQRNLLEGWFSAGYRFRAG
jgi:hypothetical protein